MKNRKYYAFLILSAILLSCSPQEDKRKSLNVTASAYNSTPEQTRENSSGSITAWGDTLRPGMKCIAISRDLLDSGLTEGTKVKIEGLEGEYVVNDKMNRRWTTKIDIYMGLDKEKATEWGKKEVTISWVPKEEKEEQL